MKEIEYLPGGRAWKIFFDIEASDDPLASMLRGIRHVTTAFDRAE
jgi:hypothetical protein